MLLRKNALGGVAAIAAAAESRSARTYGERLAAPDVRRRGDVRLDRDALVRLQRLAERLGLQRVREGAQPAERPRVELAGERARAREQVVRRAHRAVDRVEHRVGDPRPRRHRALLGVADRDERGAGRRQLVGHQPGHVREAAVREGEPRLEPGGERDHAVDAGRDLLGGGGVGVLEVEAARRAGERRREGGGRRRAPSGRSHR
jgi:hypothetical protein